MLFNSFEFLFFLPIVFLFYWFVFKRLKWQNLFLVIASYVFYGWWDWRFLILIALTTFFSYISGRLIVQYEGRRKIQKAVSGTNIIQRRQLFCGKFCCSVPQYRLASGLGDVRYPFTRGYQFLYISGIELQH